MMILSSISLRRFCIKTFTQNSLLQAIVLFGLIASSPAKAAIITGYGVDTAVKQYTIDGLTSSVTHKVKQFIVNGPTSSITYNPGLTFGSEVAQTYAISGTFGANFSRYWWSYFLDGDASGNRGTFIYEKNWLTFGNADIVGNIFPDGFAFPNYFIRVNGSSLNGYDGPCNFPLGLNTSCTGYSFGAVASLNGEIANGALSIQGSMPVYDGAFSESFTYDIQANEVPEPGMPMLLLGGLFALLITRRRLQPAPTPC